MLSERTKEGRNGVPPPWLFPSPSQEDHVSSLGIASCLISDIHVRFSPRPRSSTGFPSPTSHQTTRLWPVSLALSSKAAPRSQPVVFHEGWMHLLCLYPLCPALTACYFSEGRNLNTNTATWCRGQQFSKCSQIQRYIILLTLSTNPLPLNNGCGLRKGLFPVQRSPFADEDLEVRATGRSSKGSPNWLAAQSGLSSELPVFSHCTALSLVQEQRSFSSQVSRNLRMSHRLVYPAAYATSLCP